MAVAEDVKIVVRADVASAKAKLKGFQGSLKTSQSGIKSFVKSFAGIAGASIVATKALNSVVKMAKESYKAFKVQEQVEAKLNQTLQATGYGAGFTADQLTNMASALQKQTTFGDEAIIGAQTLLLTFKQVGEDTFPRATEAILDMSVAMGQDLKTTTIQVGKALNDPILGVTALRRVGVQLTSQQEDLIKTMVDMGDTAGAQKVILGELETQFGGVAKAVGETTAGAFDQLKNSISDYQEIAGEKLVGNNNKIITSLRDALDVVNDYERGLLDVEKAMGLISEGKDAGDMTNEMQTQLTLIRKMENSYRGRVGLIDDQIQAEKDVFKQLFNQQVKYQENIKLAADLTKKTESRAEWEALIGDIELKREVKLKQLNDLSEEAKNNIIATLDPITQENIKLSERNEIIEEEIESWERQNWLTTEQKAIVAEQIELLKEEASLNAKKYQDNLLIKDEVTEIAGFEFARRDAIGDINDLIQEQGLFIQKNVVRTKEEEAAAKALAEANEEEHARALERIEEIKEAKIQLYESVSSVALPIFEGMGEALVNGEMEWEQIGKVAVKAIAGIVRGLGEQAAVQAAIAYASLNIPMGIAYTAASGAAFIAAGIISALGDKVPAAATGADFYTNGPMPLMVGDNPGGVERVQVTPIGSENVNGPNENVHVQVYLDSRVLMDAVGKASRDGRVIIDAKAVR